MVTAAESEQKTVGRPGVRKEQVERALRELTTEGGPAPSLRDIQRFIGIGALGTISRFRQELVDEAGLAADPLEDETLEDLKKINQKMRRNALNNADYRIASVEKNAAQRVKIAEATSQEERHKRQILEADLKRMESETKTLKISHTKLEQRIAKLDAGLAELTEVKSTLEIDVGKLTTALEKEQSSSQSMRMQFDQERQHLISEHQEAKMKIKHQTASLKSIDEKFIKSKAARETAEDNFENLRAKCEGMQKDLDQSENDQEKLARRYERLKTTRGALDRDNERLKSEHGEQDKLIGELKVKLHALERFSEQRQRFFDREIEGKNEIVAGLHKKIAQSKTDS